MKCEICGKECKKLGTHIQYTHKITNEQYYNQYIKNENCKTCSKNIDNCVFCIPNLIKNPIQCQICSMNVSIDLLGAHLRRHKDITSKEYYDKYLRKSNEGICPVCGKETTFNGITYGYNINCSSKCAALNPNVQEKLKETFRQRYGVDNAMQNKEILEKAQQTQRNNHNGQLAWNTNKQKETLIEKYGVDNIMKSKEFQLKAQETNIKKYGVKNVFARLDVQEKSHSKVARQKALESSKITWLDKYGVDNPNKVPEIREKIEQTNIKKYGNKNVLCSSYGQEKSKATMLEHYGVENAAQCPEILKKMQDTQRKNNDGKLAWNNETKVRKTKLEKYGNETFNNPDKQKETMMERYGEYGFTSMQRESMIKTYGGIGNASPELSKRRKNTIQEKYGDEYEQMRYEKTKNTLEQNNKLDKELGDPDE